MLFGPDERYQDFRRADDAAIFGSLSKRRKYGLRISRYDDLTDKENRYTALLCISCQWLILFDGSCSLRLRSPDL